MLERVKKLSERSYQKSVDPVVELDFTEGPDKNRFWMSEQCLSLYGTRFYSRLTECEKLKLSHLEFFLLCSISCYGEKEVISNISKIMMKDYYDDVRGYISIFLKEEFNHIYMFSEFCRRYGKCYPSLYPYVEDNFITVPAINELLIFSRVLIFEEIGLTINQFITTDNSVDKMVKRINEIHYNDESRHISFGRLMVKYLMETVIVDIPQQSLKEINNHLSKYINTLHYDYVNYKILKEVGLKNAYEAREEIVSCNDITYFFRSDFAYKKINSLIGFLKKMGLLASSFHTKRSSITYG